MVVLGKANLSEWANIRDGSSASGWSGYGGLTRNPYALNRSAGGSSSGSGAAVAAGITPYAVGTETDGSISCPAAFNGCVGIKPTVGLVPTDGVVPISRSQDSPGPMAATVRDAAALLGVLAGNGTDYASYAVDGRLAGKRIGVPRARYWGYSSHADERAERAVQLLARRGRDDRGRHRPHQHGGVRRARRAAGHAGRAARRAGGLPRRPARRRTPQPRRRGRLEPRARRRRAAALRPVAVRAGAGGTGHRQPGVRRGAGPLRAGRTRRRHRRRAARARPGRAGHPVLRPGRADRPGQPGGAHGLLHAAERDRGLPAAHGARRAWPPGCRSPSPSGVRRPARRPWSRSPRATRPHATATRGRCRRRPSRRSSERRCRATASATPRW